MSSQLLPAAVVFIVRDVSINIKIYLQINIFSRYYKDKLTLEGEAVVLIIGLTGGISSGKSFISQYLQELGAVVIDADKLARKMVEPGSIVLHEIREYFGDDVFEENGELNRKRLANSIFHSKTKKEKLNSIIHPRVMQETIRLIEEYKAKRAWPAIVIDAPLLIEAGMCDLTDEVWVVAVDEETQIRRLMERDKLSRQEAESRLNMQMPLKEKLKYANRVIDNNGLKEDTLRYVNSLWEEIVV